MGRSLAGAGRARHPPCRRTRRDRARSGPRASPCAPMAPGRAGPPASSPPARRAFAHSSRRTSRLCVRPPRLWPWPRTGRAPRRQRPPSSGPRLAATSGLRSEPVPSNARRPRSSPCRRGRRRSRRPRSRPSAPISANTSGFLHHHTSRSSCGMPADAACLVPQAAALKTTRKKNNRAPRRGPMHSQ